MRGKSLEKDPAQSTPQMSEIDKMNEKIERVLAKEEKGRKSNARSTFTKHKLSEESSRVNFL